METTYSQEKVLAAFLLSLFFLLSVLFGATYVFVYVAGGLAALFFLLRSKGVFNQASQFLKVTLLWLLFFVTFLLSSIFSKNVPLTIDSFLFFGGGLLVFFSIFLLKEKYFSHSLLLLSLKSVVVILAFFSLFFFLFPSLDTLPRSNQLSQIGGHSHTSYLILLLLPYFWSAWHKAQRKVLHTSVLLVLYAAILSSSGRLVWFLTGWQLIGVWLFHLKERQLMAPLKKTYFTASGFCLAALLAVVLFVLPNESRPLYWQQAVSALQSFPIFGYGPGTFSLVSYKFAQFPHAYSGYAHNVFLQQFAELGLLGGLSYSVLIVGLIYFASIKQKSALFLLSIQTSVFVAFFDFDWHLAGYMYLVLALIALQLRSGLQPKLGKKNAAVLHHLPSLIVVVTLGIAGAVASVELQLSRGEFSRGYLIFPYFSYHRLLFQKHLAASEEMSIFEKIYAFHPDSFPVVTTDPWRTLANLSSTGGRQLELKEATQLAEIVLKARQYDYTPDYAQQTLLAAEVARLSESDGTALRLAYELDDWVIQNSPTFSQNALLEASCDDIAALYANTRFVPPSQFGNRRYLFVHLFNLLADEAMSRGESTFTKQIVGRMSELAPDDYWVGQQTKYFPSGYWENSAEITNSSAKQLGLHELRAQCRE